MLIDNLDLAGKVTHTSNTTDKRASTMNILKVVIAWVLASIA